jgi:hypothetical protein
MDILLEVPTDFVSINETEVHLNKEVNVIAVVVDYLPPSKSRGIGQYYRICSKVE